MIPLVLTHQRQEGRSVASFKQVIIHHPPIYIERIKEGTGNNCTGESIAVLVEMDTLSSWWNTDDATVS